jgi:DNA invertase Pin-like site-specific DNA recombinase
MRWRVVRCAIYTRQSVVRPGDSDFTSCDAQREACREFIRQRADEGWIALSHRFDDEGESGATLIRPALGELLQWVEARAVDRVVVHRLDRLTRKVLDWAHLVARFREAGTELSVVTGNLHHGMFAAGDLTLNLSVSFAELEHDIIVARLRDAHAARRSRGLRSAGRIPFGYMSDPVTRQLVIHPEEAASVARIFEMAAEGVMPATIAAWLNERGLRTKRLGSVGGHPWSARAVLRVLGNQSYLGQIGDVPNSHEAIVDAELFERARTATQQRRTREPSRRSPHHGPFFLRGLLRCSLCGRIMTTSSSRVLLPPRELDDSTHEPPRYYRCRGPEACPGSQVSAQYIEGRDLGWLCQPPRSVTGIAADVLAEYRSLWDLLFPRFKRQVIGQIVRHIRWHGRSKRLTIVLDEAGIAAASAELWPEVTGRRAQASQQTRSSRRPRFSR